VSVVLLFIFFDYAVIGSACFVGSYLTIRGISFFLGGFPNEFIIYESLAKNGRMFHSPMLYLYLLLIVVLTIFSVQNQLKKKAESESLYSYKKYDFRYRAVDGRNVG